MRICDRKMAAILERKSVKNKIALLSAGLQVAEDKDSQREEILTHIKSVENDPEFRLDSLEIPPGLTWFNSGALSFKEHLKGKLVVLDFFTYCCINCMHILPDLAQLEEAHSVEDGLVVVGVHSAKFLNEKLPKNISNAIKRYAISHPVVNDSDITLWNELGVVCWPTLVIVGLERQLLHYIIGEGHGEELRMFVDTAMEYYQELACLNKASLPPTVPSAASAVEGRKDGGRVEGEVDGILWYPGKVCCDAEGRRLFVADSSHHRVLVVERETGAVLSVYGSGRPGLRDGAASESQFHSPQGLGWNEGRLYVADTENHIIRMIEISTGTVSTLLGSGRQGNDKEGGGKGREQEISSPWDLVFGCSADHHSLLYIAMAGTHQIWVYFFEDCSWIKGSKYSSETAIRFSGSGEEANRNNSYPHKAAFAQPSGLTLAGSTLYVADSESSSVRAVAVKDGSVKALVGGAIDPLDLFAFGDADGKGREARLQHPLGVAWSEQGQVLYVADSYNHKVKVVDPATKRCTTLAGTGKSGLVDGPFEHAQFSEPGGLCLDPAGKTLFVADTNNHAIRVLDLEKKLVSQLTLLQPAASLPVAFKRLTGKRAKHVNLDRVSVQNGGVVKITLSVRLPDQLKWTEGAPSSWQVIPDSGVLASSDPDRGMVGDEEVIISLSLVPQPRQDSSLQVELMLYFCEVSGMCHMHGAVLSLPLLFTATASNPALVNTHYSPEVHKTS